MQNLSVKNEQELGGIAVNIVNSVENVCLQKKPARTRLWQLDHNYYCAVIGTCLTLDEVKKLLKLLQIACADSSSYEIHSIIVTIIANNDFRSKKVQNYLDKKFESAIKNTRKMNAEELKKEWKRVARSGDMIGTFWAVMSHPNANAEMKRDIYGDIHMLSHMSGASNRADLKRLNQLERERKHSNKEASIQQTKCHKLNAENTRLQTTTQQQAEMIADLVNQVDALKNANRQLTILNSVKERQQMEVQVEKLSKKISFQNNEIKKYQHKIEQLDNLVFRLQKQVRINEITIASQKKEAEHLLYLLSQQQQYDGECLFKNQGLCGQCVLYVGGKANLIPFYRELVEARAGIFLHHDGGLEKSTQELTQSLSRADVVVFPSDCISHDAYWQIKRICKKQNKQYKYLNSPGLYSLSSLLDKIIAKTEALAV